MPGEYVYNPGCGCDWCRNNGEVPQGTPSNGHSFGYDVPHTPPAKRRCRVVGLLSWYDEDPVWLDRCVRSLTPLRLAGLVALDGAYSLYPDAEPRSPGEQATMIRTACDAIGLPLMLEQPEEVWAGEVEKRNHLFDLGEKAVADWYFVIDADEFVTSSPNNIPERLASSPFDVAAVELVEPGHPLGTIVFPTHPKFFRAIPGLRAVRDHFTYTTPDGRRLWGDQKIHRLEARLDLTTVRVEHHKELRHPDRRRAANAYYDVRDELGVEELPQNRSLLADAA